MILISHESICAHAAWGELIKGEENVFVASFSKVSELYSRFLTNLAIFDCYKKRIEVAIDTTNLKGGAIKQ